MHPEIVKDGPGTCDICGMPLVPAESLGYVTSGNGKLSPLLIPATAPLFTGERAIIYVETASSEKEPLTREGSGTRGPRARGILMLLNPEFPKEKKVVVNGALTGLTVKADTGKTQHD
jgi:Cu(I)/Ag(I) efflux system membrane fusion protein